jgi:hypothetical protein
MDPGSTWKSLNFGIAKLHTRHLDAQLRQHCWNATIGRRIDLKVRDFIALHCHNVGILGPDLFPGGRDSLKPRHGQAQRAGLGAADVRFHRGLIAIHCDLLNFKFDVWKSRDQPGSHIGG